MDAAARLGHAAGTETTRRYARPVRGRDAEIADRLDETAGRGHGAVPQNPWRPQARGGRVAWGRGHGS